MNDSEEAGSLWELLRTLHEVELRIEAALEPIGLSLPKLGVLSKLVDAGEPLPLGTLAERCACVRSNMTQLIDRLEAEKLVSRADDPHDRRSVRAELTAQGRARHAAGVRALEKAEKEMFSGLSGKKRQELIGLLRSLRGSA